MGRQQVSRKGGGSATAGGTRFHASVGTLFAAWLLSERVIDGRLGLGNAKVMSLAAEADSPVDDLLVATSEGGYVAVQAKTGLTLSKTRGGRFYETIAQFVNYWLAGARGAGELGWDRQLDPTIDRLVVAVDPSSAATVRLDLAAALRYLREPGSADLAADKQHALKVFRSCVEESWLDATGEAPDPGFAAELARVVEVFDFDPSDRDRMKVLLEPVAGGADASSVLTALETTLIDMMAERSNVDSAALRRRLITKGVVLTPPRRIANDVEALRAHTATTAAQLGRYEQMSLSSGARASISRQCHPSIERAALGGSLLVVGEAGIGKSAVLNALARNLRKSGCDVVQLAVDSHSVQTLEGLGRELRVEHDLTDVLDAWDGPEPGWLVIDGLDAARGGDTEGVFRTLIRRTLERTGRWRVVASIRTFDLQMGQELRRLFEGAAPFADLADARFAGVRHVSVPGWTEAEFAELLGRATELHRALANAPPELVELARVPFNTNLIGELLRQGIDTVRLQEVASQTQLLRLYWEQRVVGYGTPAQICLFKTVEAMLVERGLRAAKHKVPFAQAEVFDDLSSVGVLIADPNDVWVQFRHHVLFDFAAARWVLGSDPVGAHPELGKDSANGLLLAPAMRFVLQELWERDATREEFWTAIESMLTDESLDPVIAIAAARTAVDFPDRREDLGPLLKRIAGGSEDAAVTLQKVAGALVIAMEDDPERSIEPWVVMLSGLAPYVDQVAHVFRVLLFMFVERVDDSGLRREIGTAARALLAFALGDGEQGSLLARLAIRFVANTYETDPAESRALLGAVFEEGRFERFGAQEVPALCDGAKGVLESDPEFVAEIYGMTYGRDIAADRETSMSSSQILSLRSTARQDYGMARYQLEELLGEFLVAHPAQAVRAVEDAVAGYLARKDPIPESALTHDFEISGTGVQLREDLSFLWAYDPEDSHGDDAPALVVKLLETLKSCDEEAAIRIAAALVGEVSLAVFWSRAFAAAAARADGLLDFMLPYALEGPFVTVGETRKDAIDTVAAGYDRMSAADREAFERRTLALDFERYGDRAAEARRECLEVLFGVIGRDRLVTEDAQQFLTGSDGAVKEAMANERPFRIETAWGPVEDALEGAGKDDTDSDAARAAAAIRTTEEIIRPETVEGQPSPSSFDQVCSLLEEVERRIRAGGVDRALVWKGEDVIGGGCL